MADPQAPDALQLAPHGLTFRELRELIEYLELLQEGAAKSLQYFRYGNAGFAHRIDPKVGEADKTSKASTATCVAYLKATGVLASDWGESDRKNLRSDFVTGEWKSARLPKNNSFTSAFLLEAIHALGGREGMPEDEMQIVDSKLELLNRRLKKDGGLSIKNYPRTSFLTHKVVRVLILWNALEDKSAEKVSNWNWSHLYEESMLIAADSPDKDFFELAYSVLTASLTSPLDQMTPRERRLLQLAIKQFFDGQRSDGTWPRSRPLFLYPNIGYAYCYDYELLVQLLSEGPLRPFILPHLDELRKASWALDAKRVPLQEGRYFGWSSEHHGGNAEAESWPTASVFHYCFELGELVADAVRRDVFDHLDATYEPPEPKAPDGPPLEGLLDSLVEYQDEQHSFKELFEEKFLDPLVKERDVVAEGRKFADESKVSAILYGPPGTSKTRLAEMIAKALGWPLLAVDPSHLTRRGLDNVHAETDALFVRLQFCDQIVVLLDEFDELVRERETAGEFESRFLTTAMLPKIAALHSRRRLVYVVATNHVEKFDAAISRPGRFDVIAPLMPPTAQSKLDKWASLKVAKGTLIEEGVGEDDVMSTIGDLTFLEAQEFAERTKKLRQMSKPLKAAFEDARARATMNRPVDPAAKDGDKEDWKVRIKGQEDQIRGLDL